MSVGAGGGVGLREGKNKELVQEGKKAHLKQVGLLCVCERVWASEFHAYLLISINSLFWKFQTLQKYETSMINRHTPCI